MKIIIASDLYISDKYHSQPLIDKSVEELFHHADYRIVNLEAPLTADEPKNKIFKTGPHLRMSAETVMPYLKQLKVNGVTLANNHILDYGAKGLLDTFESLKQNKIEYVGAGNNLQKAAQPITLEKDGVRIAILNICENEWSIAESDSPGANPLDIIDNVHQIKAAKATHDKVICIIHGGHEYYHLPSPRMVKQYRFYADNGADAIVGHHTHCIGGFEIYQQKPIIYGLGNFVFTLPSDRNEWYIGLIAILKLEPNEQIEVDLTPIVQEKKTFNTKIVENDKKAEIEKEIKMMNEAIINGNLLKHCWLEFTESRRNSYHNAFSPTNTIKNRIIRALLNRLGINRLFQTKGYLRIVLNLVRCESHQDALIAILSKNIKQLHNNKNVIRKL